MTTWTDLIKLLKFQLRLTIREFKSNDVKANSNKNHTIWSFVSLFILFLVIFRVSYSFSFGLRYLFPETQEQLEAVFQLELQLLALSALLLFVILLLNGIRIVYENYFEAQDLNFLLSLPVSIGNVFASKFIKNVVMNFIQVLPLIGALWLGYGFGVRGGIQYFFTMVVVLFCGAVIFTALATILLLVITRFMPSLYVKQGITIGSFALALAVFVFWQYFVLISDVDITFDQLVNNNTGLETVLNVNLPQLWMANTLGRTSGITDITFWESLFPLLTSVIISVWISIWIASKTFMTGWSKSRDIPLNKSKKIESSSSNRMITELIKKDFLILRRTPFIWYNILIFMAMLGLITFNMTRGGIQEADSFFNLASGLSLMLIIIFGTQAGGNAAGISFSLEGSTLWLLKIAPMSERKLYLVKLSFGVLINVTIMLIAFVVFYFVPGILIYPWYLSIPLIFGAAVAITSVNLYMDIKNPNFEIGDKLNQIGGDSNVKGQFRPVISVVVQLVLAVLIGLLILFTGVLQTWWMITASFAFLFAGTTFISYYCYQKGKYFLKAYLYN